MGCKQHLLWNPRRRNHVVKLRQWR